MIVTLLGLMLTLLTLHWLASTKFGQPALSSEFYNHAINVKFVAAVGKLRKNKITIRKLQHFQTNSSFTIFEKLLVSLILHVNVRPLDRVSEIRAYYPSVNMFPVKCKVFYYEKLY